MWFEESFLKYSIFSILGITLFAAVSLAAHPKISHDIDGLDPAATVDVIVQFAHAPTAASHRKVTDQGGMYRSTLSLVKSGVYSVPVSALSRLADDPEVVHISPDHKVHGMLDNTTAAVNAGRRLECRAQRCRCWRGGH